VVTQALASIGKNNRPVRVIGRSTPITGVVLGSLAVVCLSALSPTPRPAAQPQEKPLGFSLGFGIEPRLGNYASVDPTLSEYGFNEVGSPLLLTYGLRGRVWLHSGWIVGAATNFAFASRQRGDNPVPTTTTAIETVFTGGHQLGAGFDATLDAGFGSHAMTVGSLVQGGALVYLGPTVAPRIGYVPPTKSAFLRVSLGYWALFPIGAAHEQPLWGDSFRQVPIHAFVIGLESGFTRNRPRFRWRREHS